jgi:hypothetical protein
MINPAESIGLKWAAKISDAFTKWAKQEKKSRTIKITPFDPSPLIEGAFYEAGKTSLTEMGKLLGMGVKFDLRSKEAESWISNYAASQIKYLDATAKQTIRQIKLRSFQEGLTLQEQRDLIKQNIGLLPQHIIAVQNYKDSLVDLDQATVDRMGDKYANKLLNYRADMIGRTEGMASSNNGRRISNEYAVDRGVLDPDEVEQKWVTSKLGNVCEDCKKMDGKRTEIGGTFETDEGPLDCPPKHQHCSCGVVLTKKNN